MAISGLSHMRKHISPFIVAAVVLSASLLSACASSSTSGGASTRTMTFALQPGNTPNYIFPFVNSEYFTIVNEDQFEYLMYRPLFWDGNNGTPDFNPSESLAAYPSFSVNPAGDTVATVTLKHWLWSDGQLVTTRDVEFWMNLLEANKDNWGVYVPGAWPDNIKSIVYPTPQKFIITFNGRYNTNWIFNNQMSQIFPLPQQAWDKTSASSPDGNYDTTHAGAVAVYNFLNAQSRDLSSYGSNPLWKVVDGPWVLRSYLPSTGETTLARNQRYPGPSKPQVQTITETPFTSTSTEFTALRTGTLDVGYVPPEDAPQIGYLKSHGYTIAPWWEWNVNFISINFNNPQAGPLFQQLYIRQALQSLIDQPAYIKEIYAGYAKPTYGPVPSTVVSHYLSPQEERNPYPYSAGRARSLLADHGWALHPGGVDTCMRPGSGSTQCGAGVAARSRLSFTLLYGSGDLATTNMMSALKSAASTAGIQLNLLGQPLNEVTSTVYSCKPATGAGCGWQLGADTGWEYYPYPSGEQLFASGGSGNAGGYSNNSADSLIHATLTEPGLGPMYRYEQYLETDLPVLYLPTPPSQITAYKSDLRDVQPQDPELNIYPELWESPK
jgi:peptide/nickel transport system substrate-binding protein